MVAAKTSLEAPMEHGFKSVAGFSESRKDSAEVERLGPAYPSVGTFCEVRNRSAGARSGIGASRGEGSSLPEFIGLDESGTEGFREKRDKGSEEERATGFNRGSSSGSLCGVGGYCLNTAGEVLLTICVGVKERGGEGEE